MDLNRYHFFILGVVVLLAGIQFRFVDSFVLNESATRFVAEKFGTPGQGANANTTLPMLELAGSGTSGPLRTIKPPVWLSWALISGGSVLVLHSLALRKP
jgi:hypothetical protein